MSLWSRTAFLPGARARLRSTLLLTTALATAVTMGVSVARPAAGQDATWLASPGSNNYNTGANWHTGTVPALSLIHI